MSRAVPGGLPPSVQAFVEKVVAPLLVERFLREYRVSAACVESAAHEHDGGVSESPHLRDTKRDVGFHATASRE